jgi:glutamate racemase
VASGAYQRAVESTGAAVELTCAACPGFVEFVERGETDSDQVHVLAERLLAPVRAAGVDTLLLGCTHYPYLARTISDVLGRDVVLVSSADETAFEVRALLHGADGNNLVRTDGQGGTHRFLSSGDVAWFSTLGGRLLGPELATAEPVTWG